MAVAQRAFVDEDLRAGRLVAPLALRVPTDGAYYLAYPGDRPKPARVEAFEDWLLTEALKVDEAGGNREAHAPRTPSQARDAA